MDIRSIATYKIRQLENTYSITLDSLTHYNSPKLSELFADIVYELLEEAYRSAEYKLVIYTEEIPGQTTNWYLADCTGFSIMYSNGETCDISIFSYKDGIYVFDIYEQSFEFVDNGFGKMLYDRLLDNKDVLTWLILNGFREDLLYIDGGVNNG